MLPTLTLHDATALEGTTACPQRGNHHSTGTEQPMDLSALALHHQTSREMVDNSRMLGSVKGYVWPLT